MSAQPAYVVDYTAKSVAVLGDTKPIKEQLKSFGGRFNRGLFDSNTGTKTSGWIFSKSKKDLIVNSLNLQVRTESLERLDEPTEPTVEPPIVDVIHVSDCPICLEAMSENSNLFVTSCGHKFHASCIIRMMMSSRTEPSCPCCRGIIV
jgi:hypothetical protein